MRGDLSSYRPASVPTLWRRPVSRRGFLAGSLLGGGLLGLGLAGCNPAGTDPAGAPTTPGPALTSVELGASWAPKPVTVAGLSCLATQDGLPTAVTIAGIGCVVAGGTAAARAPVTFDIRWDEWNKAAYTERAKTGITTFAQALAQTSMLG